MLDTLMKVLYKSALHPEDERQTVTLPNHGRAKTIDQEPMDPQ
jgi:hypothetical protein